MFVLRTDSDLNESKITDIVLDRSNLVLDLVFAVPQSLYDNIVLLLCSNFFQDVNMKWHK
jgi:hypothetical protein